MNLARLRRAPFRADLYCLHKNRWWQTSRGPLLDSGAFVAGLEYAAGVEAVVLGKPSPVYFEAALAALEAEPKLTWIVGDDIEADIAGVSVSAWTALVRTGKFRPDDLELRDRARHRRQLARGAPRLAGAGVVSVGIDLIEIARIRRAMGRYPSFTARCFTEAERAYCDSRPNPAQHYAARFAGKEAVGKALGFGVARALLARWRSSAGRSRPCSSADASRTSGAARRLEVDLSMTHSKELASAVAVVSSANARAALHTAEEMSGRAGHDVRELMERAGKAVAEEALRRFPDATSFGAVCGGGANGGDARIALEALRAAGREAAEGLDGDVLLDGLFGTGFHGEPRADATEVIAQLNGASAPVSPSTCPPAWTRTRARSRARPCERP